MKYLFLIFLFTWVCPILLCSQDFASTVYEIDIDRKEPHLLFGKANPTVAAAGDLKFKKNRKTINYTALGLLGLGTTVGLIYTIDCKQESFGDDQCGLGVYLGTVFGAAAGLVTLLVAHPINRISNKGKDFSSFNTGNDFPKVIISYGVMNGGLGITARF